MIYSDELFDHETCSGELSIHKLFLPFSKDYYCSRHNQRTFCTWFKAFCTMRPATAGQARGATTLSKGGNWLRARSVRSCMAALIKHNPNFTHFSDTCLTEPLTPSPLADQTWVVTARFHFPFQQQIHHHLCQVAACSSLSQGGSVVKGSHVVLRRKRGSKALYLRAYKKWTSKITVSLDGK